MQNHKFKSVDEYISTFPEEVIERLEAVRAAIRAAAPKAQETISYNMPAYKVNKTLVYFAGYKHHVGFYPMPSGIALFKGEDYPMSKGAVQFPHDRKLPIPLIKRVVKFRLKEDGQKG